MADKSTGYYVVKTLELSGVIKGHLIKPDRHVRDYKRKMESLRDLYLFASDEKRICREFVDYDKSIARFKWRST